MSTRAASTQVEFIANTATFDQRVERSGDVADRAGQKIERAAERVRQAWSKETAAANAAAEARGRKSREDEMAALRADILARSEEQAAQRASLVANSLKSYGGVASGASEAVERLASAHGHAVPQMAAASAAVRTIEGNITNNIRAAERFLTTTLGLGEVLSTAFPIAGALALGAAVFELGKKAYGAYENLVNLKGAIGSINALEIDVAKKVAQAGDKTETALESILNRTAGKPAALQQKLKYQGEKPLDLSEYFYDDKFKKLPNDIKVDYEKMYKVVAPADAPNAIRNIRKEVAELQRAFDLSSQSAFTTVTSVRGFGPDAMRTPAEYWRARLTAAKQIQSLLEPEATQRTADRQVTQFDITDAQREAGEKAAQKAEAAMRKRQEAQRKQWEEEHAEWTIAAERSAADEVDFWALRMIRAQKGSDNYILAEKNTAEAIRALRRDTNAKQKEFDRAAADWVKDDNEARSKSLEKRFTEDGKSALEYVQGLRTSINLTRENASAHAEAVVQINAAAGYISAETAAIRLAEIHTQRYTDRLKELEDQRQRINDTPGLTAIERANQLQANSNATAKVESDRALESMRDYAAVAAHSWGAAFAVEMKALRDQAVNGANDLIARVATGGGGRASDYLRGLAQTGIKAGLKSVESIFFDAGKPDGSSSRPFHVVFAGAGIGSAAASAAAGASAGGSAIAKIASVFGFGGGRATGGAVSPNTMYMVGERGPEPLLMGSQGGHVISNSDARSMFGGGGAPVVHVDARGASDPAQVEASVHAAMQSYLPHLMTGAVMAVDDNRRRGALAKR